MGCVGSKESNATPSTNDRYKKANDNAGATLRNNGKRVSTNSKSKTNQTMNDNSKSAKNFKNTQEANEKLLVAIFDYTARTEEDLTLQKGDELILKDDSDEFWWLCLNKRTNLEGFAPSNYVAKKEDLHQKPWFFGNISRNEAESYLLSSQIAGSFIIRNSENSPGNYSLSVCDGSESIKHYRIKRMDNGDYFISTRTSFHTLDELLEYYKAHTDGLCCILRNSPIKISPDTQGLSKNTWEEPKHHFKLTSMLGSGNFGEVWEALYKHNTKVAIKTLKPGTMSSKEFLEEANIMKRLKHPNLVQLLAVCTESEPLYIVTEFMKNGSLLDFLRKQKNSVSLRIFVDMSCQISSGMAYLESIKFIHRDLAARNILVSHDFKYKVADFGLSRITENDEYNANAKSKFPIKWTSPEAIAYRRFTTKSDVWSFGIVMYEILTKGAHPYAGISNAETVEMINNGYRMPAPTGCEKDIYKLMLKCWNAEADKRPTFEYITNFFNDFNATNQSRYTDV